MATKMQQRRGTSSQWTAANPVLADGEIGFEKDTGVVKMGNGVSTWNQLVPILGSQYLPLLGKAADSERLDGLDSTAFAQQNYVDDLILPQGAGRKLHVHHGSGTAFPTTNIKNGDTFYRTDIGTDGSLWYALFNTNGISWRLRNPIPVATVTARDAIPAVVRHAGMEVITTDSSVHWRFNGTEWVATSLVQGKMWRTAGLSGALTNGVTYTITMNQARLSGGFLFQNGTGLIIPFDGMYDVTAKGYGSGGVSWYGNWSLGRYRTGVAALELQYTGLMYKHSDQDEVIYGHSRGVPLKANDSIIQNFTPRSGSGGQYFGADEERGVNVTIRYVGPLNGATPY